MSLKKALEKILWGLFMIILVQSIFLCFFLIIGASYITVQKTLIAHKLTNLAYGIVFEMGVLLFIGKLFVVLLLAYVISAILIKEKNEGKVHST